MSESWCASAETGAFRRLSLWLSGDVPDGDGAGSDGDGCTHNGDSLAGRWSDRPEDLSDDPVVKTPSSRGDSRRASSRIELILPASAAPAVAAVAQRDTCEEVCRDRFFFLVSLVSELILLVAGLLDLLIRASNGFGTSSGGP